MTIKFKDKLVRPEMGKVILEGYLGKRIESCIRNGVMAAQHSLYAIPFREKTDDDGSWGGEFWGKWFTSASLAYRYQPTEAHRKILNNAVEELLATQESNGRISSCKEDFGVWDVWGRKYALLGLIAYYEETGERKALDAAVHALDDLIEVAGPGKRKLTETGLSLLEALSSCSILEPIALLYQHTGIARFLEFAEYLVSLWSEPNRYTPKGMRLVEDALEGLEPVRISSPKGYEMMSCFEGLCELYRVTGNQTYLDAAVKFANRVRKKEIMIVGSGSSGELWCDGASRQTELIEQPMETCVTATWVKLCYQLLRLTQDSVWADEMEISVYNSLLSAMVPDGSWWAYFSALIGERVPSHMQNEIVQCSCCSANGPRGLLTVPGWAVMMGTAGPVVNLYVKGSWKLKLAGGQEVELLQETDYPEQNRISIKVRQQVTANYAISFRIPSWSKQTELFVNGEKYVCEPGKYVEITREWTDGDEVELVLDLRGRVMTAPGNVNQKAIMRGPVVLALDSRMVKEENVTLWLRPDSMKWKRNEDWNMDYVLLENVTADEEYIELTPIADKPEGVWMAFEVPFLYRPSHFVKHEKRTLFMCDYTSAGNEFCEQNRFRVWLPQPLYMGSAFPTGTWRILVHTEDRPKIPDRAIQIPQSGALSLGRN
ncbi:beta-L-arabinofuranosidase domain-containing protein [Cohnella phaseoli]|uniref:DUF1680 family protein n=1 Tax=Cohnella phaseoli TaxID=456490 RepID=A0A3D9KHR0_9BACL|nr:beta-L-arabinofuranosidase domain-containing protein [Cohnella phaseoli]RED85414.1 hypothetical protein DFP98_104119 [Cohnella phaseoli]